jgi:site-specific DNA recombinase
VPDSRISPELADLAREAIKDNSTPSAAGQRVWELSGGILRCGECHINMMNMMSHSFAGARVKGGLFCYCCRQRHRDGAEGCSHKRNRRADEVEPLVWEFVSGLLKEPERLRAGLERLIEQERAGRCAGIRSGRPRGGSRSSPR